MKPNYVKLNASQQLATQLRKQIERGQWQRGGSLPPMRDLAAQYRVSLSTVQKAVRELAAMKLVEQQPGQRGVVRSALSAHPASHRQIVWIEAYDPSVQVNAWRDLILHGARSVLARANLRLTLVSFSLEEAGYAEHVIRMVEPIIDETAGLYCHDHYNLLKPVLEFAEQRNVPWMTLTPTDDSIRRNFVAADNLGGGRMAGRCFARLGSRRIAVLHMGMDNKSAQDKTGGLCLGYLEREVAPPVIDLVGAFDQEEASGFEAMSRHLKSHPRPEGILAMGDYLAMGAIRACKAAGLGVPEDVSVIATSGIPRSHLHFSPTLCAVAQPIQQMGEQIASGLIHMIHEGMRRVSGRYLPCHFMPGESFNAPADVQSDWAGGGAFSGDSLSSDSLSDDLSNHSGAAVDAADSSFSNEVQYASGTFQQA